MSWLAALTDRLVLMPTTHPIKTDILQRETVAVRDGDLEIWTAHVTCEQPLAKLLVIKFPGTGGRAENSSARPANHWSGIDSVVWTVNPFGYGQSCGKATLQRYPEMVEAVAQAAKDRYPERRVVVTGNSLGAISALAFSATNQVAGVILRNPVPLSHMISRRPKYVVPSLGMSYFVAAQIPDELDAVKNAKRSSAPCLIVSAQKDRVVPVQFQKLVIDNYSGVTKVLKLPNEDHHDPIPNSLEDGYLELLDWMKDQLIEK